MKYEVKGKIWHAVALVISLCVMLSALIIMPNLVSAWAVTTPITASDVSLAPTPLTYNGTAQTPAVDVTVGTDTLDEGIDYDLYYIDNVNAGTASAVITGMGAYAGSVIKTFTITPAQLDVYVNFTSQDASEVFVGETLPPLTSFTYYAYGFVGEDDESIYEKGSLGFDTTGVTDPMCADLVTLPVSITGFYPCVVEVIPFDYGMNYTINFHPGALHVFAQNDTDARDLLTDSVTGIQIRCIDWEHFVCVELPLGVSVSVTPKHDPNDADHAALLAELESDKGVDGYAWKFNKLYDIHLCNVGAPAPCFGSDIYNLSAGSSAIVVIPEIDLADADLGNVTDLNDFMLVHKHTGQNYEDLTSIAMYWTDTVGPYYLFETASFSLFGVALQLPAASPGSGGSGGIPSTDVSPNGNIADADFVDASVVNAVTVADPAQTGTELNFALLVLFALFFVGMFVLHRRKSAH